ncbi:MAG: nucleotidyltransferase domain-containing protein [Firmicutes bacterium]|nr:nucleotidyltransferase domain-containing protein [Bacillota bacterium]
MKEEIYDEIKKIGEKYNCDKIVLFGSRARGDNRERSDIDLAIYGLADDKRGYFWWDIDELPTLLKIDLVYVSDWTSEELMKNIERDGVVIYERSGD